MPENQRDSCYLTGVPERLRRVVASRDSSAAPERTGERVRLRDRHERAGTPVTWRSRAPTTPSITYGGSSRFEAGIQDRAEPGEGRGVGVLGRPAVADDQARPVGAYAGRPEAFQPLERQPVLGGPGDELPLEVRPGQLEHRLQAGGDPGDLPAVAA